MRCTGCQAKLLEGKLQCTVCRKWNLLGETESDVCKLSDIEDTEEQRLHTGPWDLAWGGGLVTDSVSLFAGRPGSGKSSLLLMMAKAVAEQGLTVLYISKEESKRKVRNRANRFQIPEHLQERVLVVKNFTGTMRDLLDQVKPALLIVDSLPALVGLGWGDVKAAEETLTQIKEYAIENLCPAIVIDHVNRKGEFSGPIMLEHLIDVTLMMSKDLKDKNMRYLRPEKSRDGAVDVCIRFHMGPTGLQYVGDGEGEELNENDEESDQSTV